MHALNADHRLLVDALVNRLKEVPGVAAIALGGSRARGEARPDSDIDLGLYYEGDQPIDVVQLRALCGQLNDTPGPVVSEIGGWGEWVDGGAWLTINGQRVDLLYRSFAKTEDTLTQALAGRFTIAFEQQPPFGFFGPTVLGEVAIAVPLFDPRARLAGLKSQVSPMPEALVAAVVQSRLWSVDFGLRAFAPRYAASGNVLALAGCLTRFAQALVLTLFALNRSYLLNDKTALEEVAGFAMAPADFKLRLEAAMSAIGTTPRELAGALDQLSSLFEEIRALAGDLYSPAWRY